VIEYGCNALSALYHTDALLPSPEGFLLILYEGRVLEGEDTAPEARQVPPNEFRELPWPLLYWIK
jgi:hypothetical protein